MVVLIYDGHPNDHGMAQFIRATLAQFGCGLEEVALRDPLLTTKLGALIVRRDEVLCFVSVNYSALHVRVGGKLLHTATGIPLIFYPMDHPVYFLQHQSAELEGAIVFVPGSDVVDFVSKYYPARTLAINNQAYMPAPNQRGEPDFDDFVARTNTVLCPMNLSLWEMNLDGYWAMIKALPASRRAFAIALVERTLTDCFTPIHVVAEGLSESIAHEDRSALLNDLKIALCFVKLWRRNQMIRALIELPILVSSEYVPADLELKYPQKFTLLSMAETLPLYERHRFILNSFPMMTYALHDRVLNAMFANSVIITDQNNTTRNNFSDGVDAVFYDYRQGDMLAKIQRYISDPHAAFELTMKSYELRTKAAWFSVDTYGDLIEAAKRERRAAPAF